MQLTPAERDRLLLFTVAELARARRGRGLRLNVPEATALVADAVAEAARDGRKLEEAIEIGRRVVGRSDLLAGVADVVTEVKVEAVFDDGTRLAVVTDPFGPGPADAQGPGSMIPAEGDRHADNRDPVAVTVENTSSVPISVTSHFHFFEVNPRLRFDRAAAYGRRLALPAGTVQRFEAGASVEVTLVPIGGDRVMIGFAGLVDGPLDAPGARETALTRARACGYLGAGEGA